MVEMRRIELLSKGIFTRTSTSVVSVFYFTLEGSKTNLSKSYSVIPLLYQKLKQGFPV